MSTDLQVLEGGQPHDLAPRFVVSLADLRKQIVQLDEFKRSIMQQGTDYDVIPGTQKPSLLKPGAEKLAMAFGYVPRFRTVKEIQDWEGGFFYYQVEAEVVSRRTGEVGANGLGSANTKEARYRWRTGTRTCPDCGVGAIAQSKAEYGGGFYCNAKAGGCKSKFDKTDGRITSQASGRVENDDPYTLDNTVLKMAQKRALVAAVLVAVAGSGIFTQDVEDYPELVNPSGAVNDLRLSPKPEVAGTDRGEVAGQPPATEATSTRWRLATEAAARTGVSFDDPPTRVTEPTLLRWCQRLERKIAESVQQGQQTDESGYDVSPSALDSESF